MRLVQALLGLTVVAWLICESQEFGTNMGLYDDVIQQVYLREDQGTGQTNFSISLYLGPPDAARKRKHLHRGSFSWPFTKEEMDTMEIHSDIYLRKSNNYLLILKHKEDYCVTVTTISDVFFNSLQEALGLTPGGCYIPQGNYTFKDWEVAFRVPTPMLEYGSYKLVFNYLVNKKVYGCLTCLADVKRKE